MCFYKPLYNLYVLIYHIIYTTVKKNKFTLNSILKSSKNQEEYLLPVLTFT